MPQLNLYLTMLSLVAADHIIFQDVPVPREGESNQCICSIELPDTTFPSHMINFLEKALKNLTFLTEEKIQEVLSIQDDISKYKENLDNLTNTIRMIEMNGIKDEDEYRTLVQRIFDMKKLSGDLTTRLNQTDLDTDDVLGKVNNVSSMVWQLESFDQNSVLVTKRELATLRKQLADCEESLGNRNFGLPAASLLTPEYGKCDNKSLVNISKPFIVKLNWRGFNYKYGAWGKDFAVANENPDMFWVAPLNTDERLMETYRLYTSYTNLLLYKNQVERSLSQYIGLTWNFINCGQGSGHILYNGSLYYNCHNSRNLCKLEIATHDIKRKPVENAAFNNWFSYGGVKWQDFDFAGDEMGLWVIYSTEKSKGKIIIGKVDPNTLDILQTWKTTVYKPDTTGAFMICGVLYALKRLSAHKEKLFYTFDTNTGKEGTTDITFDKLADTAHSVHYNPNDHKIYMYNNGYLVTYDMIFQRLPTRPKRSVPSPNENSLIEMNQGWQYYAME